MGEDAAERPSRYEIRTRAWPSGGSSFSRTDLNQVVDEESTGMGGSAPTMLTCSGPDLDVKKL